MEWELKKDGTFVKPKGKMLWAVSESVKKPYTKPDVAKAIRAGAGLETLSPSERDYLDLESDGESAGRVDAADAVRIARKVAGLEPNPCTKLKRKNKGAYGRPACISTVAFLLGYGFRRYRI